MKYEKFEGSLGEFLEHYCKGTLKFHILLNTGYFREVCSDHVEVLTCWYEDGVYTEKEEDWTDHLPVLCWVSRLATCDEYVKLVTNISATNHFLTDDYGVYDIARPVTQEEIDKLIWKK